VILAHGGAVEDAGEVVHRMARTTFERIPGVVRSAIGRYRFSRLRLRMLERAARRSRERRYAGDWVFEVVDGDGEPFDFGVDYTECGIVEFIHARGADELTP
jgi:hypothetical protein